MSPLGRLPLRRKLIAMIMATAAVVLLIASAGYLATDYVRARAAMVRDLTAQANALVDVSEAALSFQDKSDAELILRGFEYNAEVRAACLYDAARALFAEYRHANAAAGCPPQPGPLGAEFRDNRLHLAVAPPIGGRVIGTLYVRSDMQVMERRLREQILIVLGLLLLALAVGLLVSSWVQRLVSDPVLALSRTARDVTARGDYSLRAPRTSEDELGSLVDSFNGMLERIEGREADLSRANADLTREVAERQRAEQERAALLVREREANRLKDEFLATLSHELRTPLNAILGWTRLLRTNAVPPGQADRALDKIQRNAEAQAKLVDDLLEVSRIVSGKLRLDARPVDLAAIANTAIDSLRPAAEARGVLFERRFGALALPTIGDPDRLQQVIWNLLSNAVKFTPAGGAVTISLRREAQEDILEVRDTGIGIDPQFLPHVFDTFRQADASTTRSVGGLGLGLSIVRQLVEMHGGSVRAESGGANQGATFVVRLPIRAAAPLAPPRVGDVVGAPRLDGQSVVLVDDDEDTRELLQSAFAAAGAEAIAVASADDALAACLDHRPAVLVSDIAMPGQDGYALMRNVQAALGPERPRVRIALSAFAAERDRARSTEAGFNAHLAKPIDPTDLLRVVAELLDEAAAQPS